MGKTDSHMQRNETELTNLPLYTQKSTQNGLRTQNVVTTKVQENIQASELLDGGLCNNFRCGTESKRNKTKHGDHPACSFAQQKRPSAE